MAKPKRGNRNDRNREQTPPIPTDPTTTRRAEWYTANEQLLKDVASLSLSESLGNKVFVGNYSTVNTNNTIIVPDKYIAGVTNIKLLPTIGGKLTSTSAAQIAMRNIYSWVRHANSGRSNYEAPDLFMYLLAMGQAYRWYAWLRRLYGLARSYNAKNRYYPKRLIQSMGIDFEELHANLADFRYRLNSYAIKLGSMAVPTLPYFFETMSYFDHVYLDAPSDKAQSYVFDQYSRMHLTQSGGDNPTYEIGYLPIPTVVSMAQLWHMVNNSIDPILVNEDMNIMSGDILKAYGSDIMQLDSIPEDYVVLPTYDEAMLVTINNATITGRPHLSTDSITQSNGALECNIEIRPTYPDITLGKLLNFRFSNPTPEDVVLATRLTSIWRTEATSKVGEYRSFNSKAGTLPSMIPVSVKIYTIDSYFDFIPPVVVDNGAELDFDEIQHVVAASQFDYFPITMTWKSDANTANYTFQGYLGDVDSYTILGYPELERVHQAAWLSLLVVPQVARSK